MFSHNFSPIAFSFFGFRVYWYALMYFASIILGFKLMRYYALKYKPVLSDIYNFIHYAVPCLIIGVRLGEVLFYNFPYYLENPYKIFYLWEGGVSSHGGMFALAFAVWLYSRSIKQSFLTVADLVMMMAPGFSIFIRLGNFINGEIFGLPTKMPWGVIFSKSQNIPCHPTQIYEMVILGFFGLIFNHFVYKRYAKYEGFTFGITVLYYGIFRFLIEFFKQPYGRILGLTRGQILCIPVIFIGLMIILKSKKKILTIVYPLQPKHDNMRKIS